MREIIILLNIDLLYAILFLLNNEIKVEFEHEVDIQLFAQHYRLIEVFLFGHYFCLLINAKM